MHETTAPYTTEQNGKAEQLNRTPMERVRAMLQDAKLPNNLWAEAITSNWRDQDPSGVFYGAKPDVTMMRTFGATTYVHTPKTLRRKPDPVSKKGILVGYEPGSKAYRILMEDSKKIVISRDVTFDEDNHGPRCAGSSTAIYTSNPLEEEAESNQQQSIDGSSSKDGENDQQHAQQENAEAEGAATVSAAQPAAVSAAQPAAAGP
eukprot:491601-Pelagomonas_calceolata.AAC.1